MRAESQAEDLAFVKTTPHCLGRIALEDLEVLFEDFAQGPVRDALAVRETPSCSAQRLGLFVCKLLPQLAHEACLADTGIADDRDEDRVRSLRGAAVRGLK